MHGSDTIAAVNHGCAWRVLAPQAYRSWPALAKSTAQCEGERAEAAADRIFQNLGVILYQEDARAITCRASQALLYSSCEVLARRSLFVCLEMLVRSDITFARSPSKLIGVSTVFGNTVLVTTVPF